MFENFSAILLQSLLFLPLALGISISFNVLRATDMTLDGSFVLGAAVFAKLITLGFSPYSSLIFALLAGTLGGALTACIQRNDKVDALLAGILSVFILSSVNLILMGKPNINLLTHTTLFSVAFEKNNLFGMVLVAIYIFSLCGIAIVLLRSRLGLLLRAFGDNPNLLKRMGHSVELYRLSGFALTNLLAAAAGCFTAQNIGYADVSMGFGMTLTGIGAMILGQQIFSRVYKTQFLRATSEFIACLIGVIIYFALMNFLLHLDIDPIYLKMALGLLLVFFLRTAPKTRGAT